MALEPSRRFWICQWCGTQCVDYPTLREHLGTRCKVVRWRKRNLYARKEEFKPEPKPLCLEDFM